MKYCQRPALFLAVTCFLAAACSTGGTTPLPSGNGGATPLPPSNAGSASLPPDDQKRVDDLVLEAKQQYEEGSYSKTYELAVKAREFAPYDLEAMLLQGWALLQSGHHDDWVNPGSGSKLDGARTVLTRLLELSPNEFKASQGLASMDFREYFDFRRKAELLASFRVQFTSLAAALPGLRGGAAPAEEIDRRRSAFLKDWRVVDLRYRELQAAEAGLFANPEDLRERLTGTPWKNEEFNLVIIDSAVRANDFLDLGRRLTPFAAGCEKACVFWEKRALARLQSAAEQFADLEVRAPNYYHIKHDLALVHLSLGDYFMQKALKDAEADFRRQAPDAKVPESEWAEVIADFYADKQRHQNPRRAIVEQEFKIAAKKIEEYVTQDEAFELRGDAAVNKAESDFTTNTDRNAVVRDVLDIYSGVVKDIIREKRERRKNLLIYLLMIYIYPKYGNQDLSKARTWVRAFEDADVKDPVSSFIRAVIYERGGDWQSAIEEYRKFLGVSSIAIHANRRDFARTHIRELEAKINRAASGSK